MKRCQPCASSWPACWPYSTRPAQIDMESIERGRLYLPTIARLPSSDAHTATRDGRKSTLVAMLTPFILSIPLFLEAGPTIPAKGATAQSQRSWPRTTVAHYRTVVHGSMLPGQASPRVYLQRQESSHLMLQRVLRLCDSYECNQRYQLK